MRTCLIWLALALIICSCGAAACYGARWATEHVPEWVTTLYRTLVTE